MALGSRLIRRYKSPLRTGPQLSCDGSRIPTIGGPVGAGLSERRDRVAAKKTILNVGASRGLGLALAGEYCARDWQVIATSRGRSDGLDKLVERYPTALEI